MLYSEILLTAEQLDQIVSRLAREITCVYPHTDDCLALVVMGLLGLLYLKRGRSR